MESLEELEAMTMEQLRARINEMAPNAQPGVSWYLDEFVRRNELDLEKATLVAVERQVAVAERTAEMIRQGGELNERMVDLTADIKRMTRSIQLLTLAALVAATLGVLVGVF